MSAKKITGNAGSHERELIVTNKLGIHARPAALFVKTANRFACDIFVEKDGEKINGKSIMGLMMLAAGPGSKLTVHAIGADASKALAEIESLIKRMSVEDDVGLVSQVADALRALLDTTRLGVADVRLIRDLMV